MSRRSAPRHNYPKGGQRRRYIRDYPLAELFDEDELALKLLIAEQRILKAFARATCKTRGGKERGTDNYIIGVGPNQKDLVDYVMEGIVRGMRSGIVCFNDLPEELGNVKSVLGEAANNANRRLLAVQLQLLCERGEIWFENWYGGSWNVCTSAMDRLYKASEATKHALKIDDQLRRQHLHGGRLMKVH